MPTIPTHLKPSTMAVAVDHHHHTFKPWKRRFRLRSFPQADATLLDAAAAALPSSSSSRGRNFHRSLSTPCFSSSSSSSSAEDHNPNNVAARVEILGGSRRSRGIHSLVVEAAVALASGAVPVPASSGLGGAYFLRNHRSGEFFAVVKPIDQDPPALAAANRPGSRLSVRAGETGLREVAAYILDHGGFSSVPPTALVRISHPADAPMPPQRKVASIQRFVPHDFDAGDLGPSRFSVASVHRVGILDVRLLNVDRHAGNLLVRKRRGDGGGGGGFAAELVPIDHGLCLPELLDDPYYEWLHWPQAAVPFSDAEAEYISSLDPFDDAELLRSELPSLREPAIRILVLCTVFLKRAAAADLCLAEIGGMMTRELCGIEEEPSALESLCKRAGDEEEGVDDHHTACDDDEEEEEESIQFDMDVDDDDEGEGGISEALDIPLLLRRSGETNDAEEEEEEQQRNKKKKKKAMKSGSSSISKSVSLSAAELNAYECGGGGGSKGCVSFKGMSEEQWGTFLERFEQLLPEAFEARKSMGGLKQRLGTSCKF